MFHMKKCKCIDVCFNNKRFFEKQKKHSGTRHHGFAINFKFRGMVAPFYSTSLLFWSVFLYFVHFLPSLVPPCRRLPDPHGADFPLPCPALLDRPRSRRLRLRSLRPRSPPADFQNMFVMFVRPKLPPTGADLPNRM